VIRFLLRDPHLRLAWKRHGHEFFVKSWIIDPPPMQPVAAAANWDVPVIESIGALADFFWLKPEELDWFADLKGLGYRHSSPLIRHYHYRAFGKRSGGVRLIESPKPRLKEIQRLILARILQGIPPHPSVHGFVKKRCIMTFAAPHVKRRVVLRMDLRDFFPSFSRARVQSLFRTAGYPEPVADALGGLCTNVAPRDIWNAWGGIDSEALQHERTLYDRPHLPQGAPSSPALANLCAYRLDCRLSGLAESIGANYTRYADDLAFSGDAQFSDRVNPFSTQVAAILLEEGFAAQHHKTRVMRRGRRQYLAGLVVNERTNITRDEFDRLKATLTNCVRLGPEGQNREGHARFRDHLEGRISFVEMINPSKGARLRRMFGSIVWPDVEPASDA
jgi:hypothetical protein